MIERLLARARERHDAAALVVFRVVLGTIVTISALRFLAYGWVDELFVKPTFFFKYWGFSWVHALPGAGMHVLFVALAVMGVMFAFGIAHRIVAPLLFVAFAYVQLIDVTNWLNHYYLVSLLLLLSSFMPLGRGVATVPAWCTWLLRFQVGVVYFYAGLAKLSGDWLLHAQPLDIWLHARTDVPILGALFGSRTVAYAFAWGGFLFDTMVPAFLLWRRSRPFAYAVLVGFHATVGLLFPIGMFPWIMIASALVFFDPSWPRKLLLRPLPILARVTTRSPARTSRVFAGLALAYCALQVLVPLRTHVYGGNVLWHEQGMRFSWRVMAREKNGSITYVAFSPKAGRTWFVSPRKYLTDRQERELSSQPDLVLQLAHHVRDELRAQGHDSVQVRVEAIVSLNGRAGAPMIDPKIDLATVDDGMAKASWILPAPEGPPIHLRSRPWSGRLASR
jgi:vitamin K-dependent gamma-carboxylase